MTTLVAGVASVEEIDDLETYVVGFAENADGSGWNMMFQLSLNITQQDVDLGEDTSPGGRLVIVGPDVVPRWLSERPSGAGARADDQGAGWLR